jgi:cyanophycinase
MRALFCLTFFSFTSLIFGQGFICAVGGGSEDYNDWSDQPYGWIVQKSDSGKIIILSYEEGSTNWLPEYFSSLGADTVYNKAISSTEQANLQSTYDELITAKAIFLRGGDQWQYISKWRGTKTEDAILYVYQQGGVIAGTSAGAAVLGEVDFSAEHNSTLPRSALINPFGYTITLENDFLDLVPDVIFDTHFTERGRFGRLIPFLYHYHFQAGEDLLGAGIDDRTAICIDDYGIGTVMGSGAVAIFRADDKTSFSSYNSGDYTIENLKCDQLTSGWQYDFLNKRICFIPSSASPVDTTVEYYFPKTDTWLTGDNTISSFLNNGLNSFLTQNSSQEIVVLSHPGYGSELNVLTNYLDQGSYNYAIVLLDEANLNSVTESEKIQSASCFIAAGDSLEVLSLLNDSSFLVPQTFYQKINNRTPIFLFGNSGKISGKNYIDGTDDYIYASYYGEMTNNIGLNLFGDLVYQPLLFDSEDYYENRTSALLWGLMLNRRRLGIYSDGISFTRISGAEKNISSTGSVPVIIVDALSTTYVDSSEYHASSNSGTRQIVAMNNLRYSLTTYNDLPYSLLNRKFAGPSGINNLRLENKTGFYFENIYPNPFNPSTRLTFYLDHEMSIKLKVFDILGNEVQTLVNEKKLPGEYSIIFNGSSLSSGIYFCRLESGNNFITKKIILLK